MKSPLLPPNENARLQVLRSFEILDSAEEQGYDDFTRIASLVCGVPISLISLIDESRQWFKSKIGIAASETPREISFCGHAILQNDVFVVRDTLEDPRFADNPLVVGDPNIRFYAGVPLVTDAGYALGTLCVIDSVPRVITPEQEEILKRLGRQVMARIETLKTLHELQASEAFRTAILTSALDAIVTIDRDGRVVEFNPAAEGMFGFVREDVLGLPIGELIVPPALRAAHNQGLRKYLETGVGPVLRRRIEVPALHADGHEFFVELAITPISVRGTAFFTAYLRDISSRKRAEARGATQQAVTRVLAEATSYDKALPLILQAICQGLGWDQGNGWEVDRTARILRNRASWCAQQESFSEFINLTRVTSFALGEGLPGRVWLNETPAWIKDVVKDANFPRGKVAASCGLHGAFAFPLQVESRTLGVLEFFSREIRAPEPELLAMFATIGNQIGQFAVRKRSEQRFAELNRTMLRLGSDVSSNFLLLASTSASLLNASWSVYLRLDGETLHSFEGLNTPREFPPEIPLARSLYALGLDLASPSGTSLIHLQEGQPSWPEGMQTYLGQTVSLDGKVVGILCLFYPRSFEPEPDEKELCGILGTALGIEEDRRKAGLQLAEARREEVRIAARIQETLLMGPVSYVGAGYTVSARSIPSSTIDGDFFDVFPLRSGMTDIVIGDVMGKGVRAALLGAATKTAIQRTISRMLLSGETLHIPSPREVLASLHADIVPTLIDLESFVTLIYVRLAGDGRSFQLVNCGHPAGMILHSDGSVSEHPGENVPVGFTLRENYVQQEFFVNPGDFLIMYSDGVTEALSPAGEMFGQERLRAFLQGCVDMTPHRLVQELVAEVSRFSGKPLQTDDLTLLVTRFRTPEANTVRFSARKVLKAEMNCLSELREMCQAFCQEHLPTIENFPEELVLAVNEAATNIINHSYHGETGHTYEVLLEAMTEGIRVQLTHSGDGFAGRSTSTDKIDDRQESGFGVFIMERAVDRVEYIRCDQNHNAVILEKSIRSTSRDKP